MLIDEFVADSKKKKKKKKKKKGKKKKTLRLVCCNLQLDDQYTHAFEGLIHDTILVSETSTTSSSPRWRCHRFLPLDSLNPETKVCCVSSFYMKLGSFRALISVCFVYNSSYPQDTRGNNKDELLLGQPWA